LNDDQKMIQEMAYKFA